MKITSNPDALVETSGLGDSGSFTIKQSPKAFQILSSGLYSNKPLAIVRELTCNAYDAHVMVGRQSTPIEVKLPNKLDTQFYVKDFGPGLSHAQVMHLYTTYFDSTKTNSNDFIGGLGLGSKSPFSYTDSFTVESRQNGIARTYGAYVNDDGIPTIAMMTEQPTTDSDGLTVGFPVKPEDYDSFSYEARAFLRWMQPAPVLKGETLSTRPEPQAQCPGVEVYASYPGADDTSSSYYKYGSTAGDTNGTWVRMGQVNYPVDWHSAGLDEHPFVQLLEHTDRAYLLQVPIGSLNVAASREGLQYDKQGKKEIAQLLKTFAGNLIDHLNSHAIDLKNKMTGFEAGTEMNRLVSSWGFDILHKDNLAILSSTSGKTLDGVDEVLTTRLPGYDYKTFSLDYFTGGGVRSDSDGRYQLTNGTGYKIGHRGRTLVVECDTKGYLRAISELHNQAPMEPYYQQAPISLNPHYRIAHRYARTLVIVPTSSKVRESIAYKEELAAFLESIGSPLLRQTSEVASKQALTTGAAKRNTVEEVLAYAIDTHGIKYYAEKFTNSNPLVWFPLEVGAGTVELGGKHLQRHSVDAMLKYLRTVAANFNITLPPIVGVAKTYQRRMATFDNATPFDTFLENFFKEPVIAAALAAPLRLMNTEQSSSDTLKKLRDILGRMDQTSIAPVQTLVDLAAYPKELTQEEPLARLVVSVHALLGKGPQSKLRQLDQAKTYSEFCKAFPLFSTLTQHVTADALAKKGQLQADVVRYINERKDTSFSLVWSTVEYK